MQTNEREKPGIVDSAVDSKSLVDLADPILSLAARLSAGPISPKNLLSDVFPESLGDDLERLHDHVKKLITKVLSAFDPEYENNPNNVKPSIRDIRLGLCALVDDLVKSHPWGGVQWQDKYSLCKEIARQAGYDEEFFEVLDRVKSAPQSTVRDEKLKFFLTSLMLGFRGKYDKDPKLAEIEIKREINEIREILAPPKPPIFHPVEAEKSSFRTAVRSFPSLLIPFVVVLFLLVGLGYFRWSLDEHSTSQAQTMTSTKSDDDLPTAINNLIPIIDSTPSNPLPERTAMPLEQKFQIRFKSNSNVGIVRNTLRNAKESFSIQIYGLFSRTGDGRDSVVIESDKQLIRSIAEMLPKDGNCKYKVTGHTTREKTKEPNFTISVDRAKSVYNLLVQAAVPTSAFDNPPVEGVSDARILSSPTLEYSRVNRRAEIQVSCAI